MMNNHVNNREPNYYVTNGKFYLVRCFACSPEHGKENYAMAVATGQCAWCGWKESEKKGKNNG